MTDSTVAPPRAGVAPWLHAVRRTWWIILLLFVAVPGVLVLQPGSDGVVQSGSDRAEYRATATVAAVQLRIDVDRLARVAEATFQTADVGEAIRRSVGYEADGALPPDATTVEPVRDTIIVRVHGTEREPQLAADLANAAAVALVEELNEIGPGLGRFEVIDRARVPIEERETTPSAVLIVVGVVGAAALSIALLIIWMALRRPVLTAEDVRAATDADWVAEVLVPRRRVDAPAAAITGFGQVKAPSSGTVVVAGVGTKERDRTALSRAIAMSLGYKTTPDVVLVGRDRDADVGFPAEMLVATRQPGMPWPVRSPDRPRVVDLDTSEVAVDVVSADEETFVVLVVAKGVSIDRVRAARSRIESERGLGAVLLGRAK